MAWLEISEHGLYVMRGGTDKYEEFVPFAKDGDVLKFEISPEMRRALAAPEYPRKGVLNMKAPRRSEYVAPVVPKAQTVHPSGLNPGDFGDDLAGRIVKYMLRNKNPAKQWLSHYDDHFKLYTKPGEINIVYLEDCNFNGEPYYGPEKTNTFNDLRLVIQWQNGYPKIIHKGLATTEPSSYWTRGRRSNPGGAARIMFGQWWGWHMGFHNWKKNHPCLFQCAPVAFARDFNQDYSRKGDKVVVGTIGANQHHGYNHAVGAINAASAGCLVERLIEGHFTFMSICRKAPQYKRNSKYIFSTTVLPSEWLF